MDRTGFCGGGVRSADPACQRGIAVRSRGPRGRSVPRFCTADGRHTRCADLEGGVHSPKAFRVHPDRFRRPRHRRGAGASIGTTQNIGHLLFLSAGLAWACYTVAMRRARLDGLHAAALGAVASMAIYLPIYAWFAGSSVFGAPLPDILLQAIVQGFFDGCRRATAVRANDQHTRCDERRGVPCLD